jgi:RimJ/RimL family protein N-acetyltransferase
VERLVSDPRRCFEFVLRQERIAWSDDLKAIGLERDGELVGVALYHGWSGPNIWIHAAKAPGVTFTSRLFTAAAFDYPFNQLGVKRISAHVEEVNVAANRLVRHLGFKPEARLECAARAGGDVIIYRMWRRECRFVVQGEHDGWQRLGTST